MLKLDKTNLQISKPLTTICRKDTVTKTVPSVKSLRQNQSLVLYRTPKTNVNARIEGMKSIHYIFMMIYAVYTLHLLTDLCSV